MAHTYIAHEPEIVFGVMMLFCFLGYWQNADRFRLIPSLLLSGVLASIDAVYGFAWMGLTVNILFVLIIIVSWFTLLRTGSRRGHWVSWIPGGGFTSGRGDFAADAAKSDSVTADLNAKEMAHDAILENMVEEAKQIRSETAGGEGVSEFEQAVKEIDKEKQNG